MYTPTDEAMLQLGLYDYVWGDNTMLQNYLSRAEAEKNREAQRAYNDYLKEYDRAKLAQEEAVRKAQEEKEKDVKRAELLGKLKDPEIGAKEKAIYRKQLEALGEGDKQLADEIEDAIQKDLKAKADKDAAEADRQRRVMEGKAKFLAELNKAKSFNEKINMLHKLTSGKDEDIQSLLNEFNFDISDWTDEDKKEIYNKVLSTETQQEANKGAVKGAVATHLGKKTAESLEEKAEKKKLADSARKKKADGQEGRITKKEQEALDEGF